MLFRKVRVSHFDDKDKLYRVMYVPDEITLHEFAWIIMRTFRADEGHMYEFTQGKKRYISADAGDDFTDWEDISEYRLCDPGMTYRFVYDFGDWWEFEVRIYKKTEDIDTGMRVIVEEGKGAGIWEDNRMAYSDLLSGEFPGDLSEDDEENGRYLPWNLTLEKASDTFAEIDADAETEYLNTLKYEPVSASGNKWRTFSRLLNAAEDSFMYPGRYGAEWVEAYIEFRRVCEQMKADDTLPETFAALCLREVDFHGESLIEHLADELPDYERFEELWQIMNELENMFAPDGITEFEIIRGKAAALKGMRKKKDFLAYVNRLLEQYPDNFYFKGLMLQAYRLSGKKQDGIRFMESVLEKEPECTEDNYSFYAAAAEFAQYAGMKALARKLRDSIDREDARQMEEMDDEFDIEDFEGDFPGFDELRSLRLAISDYCRLGTEEAFDIFLRSLTDLAASDGYIFVPVRSPEESQDDAYDMLMATDTEGKMLLPLFTEPEDILPEGHTFVSLPIVDVLEKCTGSEPAGVLFDYHPQDPYNVIMPANEISHYLATLRKYGVIDEYEPEESAGQA